MIRSRFAKSVLFAVWGFLSVGPSIALGQTVAVVGSDGCDQNAIGSNVRKLREALARRMEKLASEKPDRSLSKVLSEEEMMSALGGVPKASMADLERALAGSRDDLLNMAYKRATQPLERIIEQLMLLPPSTVKCESLRDAYTKLAWAYRKQNKEAECASAINKIVRFGIFFPDADLFPPSFHQYIRKKQQEISKKATAVLNVITKPAGSTIYINGCPMGASPAKIALPPDEYRIEVAFLNGRTLPRTVNLEGEATVEFEESFDGSVFVEKGPCIASGSERQKRLKSLVRMGSLVGADTLVALREEEPARNEKFLVVTLVEGGRDHREARVKFPPGGALDTDFDKLATFIASGDVSPPVEQLGKAGIALPSSTVIGDPSSFEGQASSGTWKKAIGWSLAGAAVVLGVVAVIEHKRVGDYEKDMEALKTSGNGAVDPASSPRFFELRSSADSASKWRTISAVSAGVAAAGSGVFLWMSYWPSKNESAKTAKSSGGFIFGVNGSF